jgi:hypothetical protein
MLLEVLNLDIPFIAAGTADIAGATKDASTIALGFARDFWSHIFLSGLFGRICLAVQPILGAGVIYKGWQIIEDISSSNKFEPSKLISSILSLLFVYIMLKSSGQIASASVLGLRNYTNNVSDVLLAGVSADFKAFAPATALAGKINSKPILQAFQRELRTCAGAKANSPNCVSTAITNLEIALGNQGITAANDPELFTRITELKNEALIAEANTATTIADKNLIEQALDVVSNFTDIGNLFQHLVEVLLAGVAFAFFLSIEITLLLFGLIFPVNLTLSLFDPAPLKSWIGNFWTLVNAKLCFSIITGIIVQLQAWMETKNGNVGLFVIELLLAVFAPVATFFYCQSSALALAGALNSMASAPFRGAGAAVSGGAKGFTRGFVGGSIRGLGRAARQRMFNKK